MSRANQNGILNFIMFFTKKGELSTRTVKNAAENKKSVQGCFKAENGRKMGDER